MALKLSVDISAELKDKLEAEYRSGVIDKNQYLVKKGKLQERIDRGWAIRRTPAGWALKILLFVLLAVSGVLVLWWFPGWIGYIMGGVQLVLAIAALVIP